MSFFEPLPSREPDPGPRAWAAPVWDRPSEGTFPALLPVGEIAGRVDAAVVAVESVSVYPNGFTINVVALLDPHLDRAASRAILMAGSGRSLHDQIPRVGVRFADGRTAGRETFMSAHQVPRDPAGLPTQPILTWTGGGGGSHGYRFAFWVFPLPPDGPLDIHVAVPGADDEAVVTLDGAEVRAAAQRATVIWS